MGYGNDASNAKKLALGGVLLALTVTAVFFAVLLPASKLSLYALSSFFVSIVIIESGAKYGWMFYIASCILSFVIVQEKTGAVPFLTFFGIYGIIKYYAEKIANIVIEYVLKLIYFNINLASAFLLAKQFVPGLLQVGFPLYLTVIGFEAAFIVYDYVYTLFIKYYRTRLRDMLKIGR